MTPGGTYRRSLQNFASRGSNIRPGVDHADVHQRFEPGPEGERAEGYLDDDEDSAGHRLTDTVRAALNRQGAIERTLTYFDSARQRKYEIQPGDLPFFMHRERGLHLDEPELRVDGQPVPAAILGAAMTLYHAGSRTRGAGRACTSTCLSWSRPLRRRFTAT